MTTAEQPSGFVPPPYPYDLLNEVRADAAARHDSVVDLSIGTPFDPPPAAVIGTPFDPPPAAVIEALASGASARSYPPSVGPPAFHDAVRSWLDRRFGVTIERSQVGATIGSKEFVASLPQYMALRDPSKDTVLYPAVSYPSYEMGATLAGLRAVKVPLRPDGGGLDLDAVELSDRERALLLWCNSPGNPTGHLEDLEAVATWGRSHGIPVFSDECYIEFTWRGPGRTILEHGLDGVVAVHSLSKRSNFAGARAGFYCGDGDIVEYLREVRKHAGMMVPGPAQAAAIAAFDDDDHVDYPYSNSYS